MHLRGLVNNRPLAHKHINGFFSWVLIDDSGAVGCHERWNSGIPGFSQQRHYLASHSVRLHLLSRDHHGQPSILIHDHETLICVDILMMEYTFQYSSTCLSLWGALYQGLIMMHHVFHLHNNGRLFRAQIPWRIIHALAVQSNTPMGLRLLLMLSHTDVTVDYARWWLLLRGAVRVKILWWVVFLEAIEHLFNCIRIRSLHLHLQVGYVWYYLFIVHSWAQWF